MMAPLPNPTPGPRPDLPQVRFEVRAAGRSAACAFAGEEFLCGTAPGCDLRLPLAGGPPVAVQFLRKPEGLLVRRVAPALAVTLNGKPLPTGVAVEARHGDEVALAGLTLAVQIPSQAPAAAPHFLSPKLVSLDDVPTAAPVPEPPAFDFEAEYAKLDAARRALDAEAADRRAAWEAREAEFERRRRDLDRYADELAADRTLWHERRQAVEQELSDARAQAAARARAELEGLRDQWAAECARQRDELARQARELTFEREAFEAARDALEPQRQQLRDEQARTSTQAQELARQRELFAADRDIFARERETFDARFASETERLTTWETALTARDEQASRREELVRTARDEFESERARFRDDLAALERRSAACDRLRQELDARTQDVDLRLEQLKSEAAEWEDTVRLATAEQERLRAEAERLARHQAELDTQSAQLAERAGQLEAQQAVLAVSRAKLDRSRQDMEREAWQLAAARAREDEALGELRRRIQEAEEVRAALSAVQATADQERRRLDERDSLLATGLEEIRIQKDALAAESERLRAREAELDARAAEFAEQAGMLKGRMSQAVDLQSRLEADRVALRERESALTLSEEARLALQEQLRRRAEELAARAKSLDEQARQLASERVAFDQARAADQSARQAFSDECAARAQELDSRAAALDLQTAEFATKEQSLARQVARLRDVGAATAAERKSLAAARATWEADRSAAVEAERAAREELTAFRARVETEFAALRAEAPELDDQAKLALERLGAARDMLRGHLSELNEFARVGRAELEAARAAIRAEAEQLRERSDALDRAKDEHRLAVAAFRQQLIEWQGTVADMRRLLSSSETRLDAKQAAAAEAATAAADASRQLAEEAERLRRERETLTARRTEIEGHLGDMREWYRKKLRELARGSAEPGARSAEPEPTRPRLADTGDPVPVSPRVLSAAADDLEPGDRQLGELLRSLGLVDADTLTALWDEATRQRRTLRQVLLASGSITLYQLALIEAGNLDALVLGRFRVIDRLRVTPKEALYRVFDPKRAGEPSGGLYLLRHLSEAEMHDAVHPDEFRQRFAAARDAAHPHLAGVVEVLDVNGRPAVLLEWQAGLFSADWPAFAAHPGCWVRLALTAAGALDAAHRAGLVHGRLTSDSFVLTPDGTLKVTGFGEPPWLASLAPTSSVETSTGADLRAFGQVLFGWSQLAGKKRTPRAKGLPESLWAVIRRLEADAEPPMADTVSAARPYESAGELVADLERLARETPFSADAWEKLLKYVADNAPDAGGLRKAG